MDGGESPLSSGAKIRSIASVVAEKNACKAQDDEQILVGFL